MQRGGLQTREDDLIAGMNAERLRTFLLTLPHVVETEQFAGLVYWVGDKAIGGKMFCMVVVDRAAAKPVWYPVGQEHFHELLEREGFAPAPYLARVWWVAAERWDALRDAEWEEGLRAAHALKLATLPPKTLKVLALPAAQQRRIVSERRKLRAAKKKPARR